MMIKSSFHSFATSAATKKTLLNELAYWYLPIAIATVDNGKACVHNLYDARCRVPS